MSTDTVTRIPWTIGEIIHLTHKENGSSKVYLVPERDGQNGTNICIQAEGSQRISVSDSAMAGYDKISGQWQLAEHIKGERLDKEFVWSLFHRCWGNASSSKEYDKSDWNALAEILRNAGYEV